MSIPSVQQLQERAAEEKARLERLQSAYAHFMVAWERIEKEQSVLVEQVSRYSDKLKLRDVLQTIHAIKE